MINKKLKILYVDYETCSQIGKFYGSMWQTNITKVLRDFQIMSGSYSWEGENKVYSVGQDDFPGYKKGVFNDKEIVKFFSKLCDEADYVVAQNGDAFDIKVLTTRIAFYGLPAIPALKTFDTKKQAKGNFKFPSNSIKYMAQFFGIESKGEINLLSIEDKCEAGDKKAWAELKKYGKTDTVILKKLFSIFFPYVKIPIIFNNTYSTLDTINLNCVNPTCLSKELRLHKKRKVVGGYRNQYQCAVCGSYTTDKKTIRD